jgi:hypothetical protein
MVVVGRWGGYSAIESYLTDPVEGRIGETRHGGFYR